MFDFKNLKIKVEQKGNSTNFKITVVIKYNDIEMSDKNIIIGNECVIGTLEKKEFKYLKNYGKYNFIGVMEEKLENKIFNKIISGVSFGDASEEVIDEFVKELKMISERVDEIDNSKDFEFNF